MKRSRHLTVALLAATIAGGTLAAQEDPQPGQATFLVFLRSQQVGQERVTLTRTQTGWLLEGTGRLDAPVDLTTEEFSMRYAADWQPVSLTVRTTVRGVRVRIDTSFGLTTAISEIRQGDQTSAKTDEMPARTVVLPGTFVSAYEALAARLADLREGRQLHAFVPPQGTVPIEVRSVSQQRLQRPGGPLALTRYEITLNDLDSPIELQLWVDANRRLARVEVPAASLMVAREDVASVMTRIDTVSNPGDEDVQIPGNGFSLAATLTRPADGAPRPPAVVLVGGATSLGRDEVVEGVPVLGELAGGLAAAGFAVVRYDRRGVGQSGGRAEAATLAHYAEDARNVVRYLRDRRDIDKDRVAVLGYGSEGGAIALTTATREKRVAAVVLVGAMGTTGARFVLDQQQRVLANLTLTDAEKAERIEMQRRILSAVTSGNGWDDLPASLRVQADTPWFRSFLAFDPRQAFDKARQPVLVVQLGQDLVGSPDDAGRLLALANGRRRNDGAALVTIQEPDHTLAPPAEAEGSERHVSPAVAAAIAEWLKPTLADR